MLSAAAEPDGRDRYVDWYYKYKLTEESETRSHSRPALLGQVHLPRQQSRHQLLAGHHVQLAEVLPGMAPADHARPARIAAAALHLQRTIAAEPDARPDPLRRDAVVLEFRNDQDDQLRHARRVDARVRRYVVARLSGLHEFQSQRHAAHVRDVRQRRRQHDAAQHAGGGRRPGGAGSAPARGCRRRPRRLPMARRGGRRWTRRARRRCRSGRPRRSGGPRRRNDGARMVSPAASATHAHLVHAQQHELHGDRRALGAGTDRQHSPRPCSRTST